MELKEEIRSRLNIEDVIGEYVELKRAGRNFKGLSPFSQEKTASFMVSPEKHIWHDFSSGEGGDVFTFVMEMEGVDFRGALDLLARKAGIDITQYQTKGDSGLSKKKEQLLKAMDLASRFYFEVHKRSPIALDYFKQRRLNQKIIEAFRLGYSPTNDELLKALLKREFTERELRDAGLVVTRRGGPSDMFRGRMMIPLMDPQGRVIGFTARILTDQPNAPKYINTPQTLLYDKGRHVFGLHLAKEAVRQKDCVVVVEGNMDVIASHQAGVKNVVATAGTALTEHHLRTLSRFTQDVRLCFDADKAGVSATERGIAIASNLGLSLSIVVLSDGAKDPDELIQKDVKLWRQAIDTPKDAVEWLLDEYARRYDLVSADGKRRATDQALQVVRTIADPVLLEHYLTKIAQRVDVSLGALTAKLGQQPTLASRGPLKNRQAVQPIGPDLHKYQDHLLALTWTYPPLRDSLLKLDAQEFAGELRQQLALHLKDGTPLLSSDEMNVKIAELELIAEAKYPALADEHYFVAADIAKRVKKEYKQRTRADLAKAFQQAGGVKERTRLNKQIKELDKQIETLKH